jgi:hypothetical protein
MLVPAAEASFTSPSLERVNCSRRARFRDWECWPRAHSAAKRDSTATSTSRQDHWGVTCVKISVGWVAPGMADH